MMPPRIRARHGQGDDGKWYFEISLWTFDGETQIEEPFQIGPFETKKIVLDEMHKAVRLVCESIQKHLGAEVNGKYLDFKNGGVLTPWDKN